AVLKFPGQGDGLEILPVPQVPFPAFFRVPQPLALWIAAGLLAITEPGIGRVPLPTYTTWTLSIPELFAHLPSLMVHLSPGNR
ncbi:MAG: hypothetical protein PHI97_04905, partial [Desulfobulbus sp.]|nr:hypothetical protein [Desulfobulbus sp.]